MKLIIHCQGQVVVDEVAAPQPEAGTVLVAVDHSCLSVGTELRGLATGGPPLWKRALRHPDKVKRALDERGGRPVGVPLEP